MKYILVDIETDGPVPGLYSMLSLGACTLDIPEQTWYNELQPLRDADYKDDTVLFLAQHGLNRGQLQMTGVDPGMSLYHFNKWLKEVSKGEKLRFVADNAGFDWMFVAYYLERYVGSNIFGFSPLSLTSLNCGLEKDVKKGSTYKKLRTISHSHNALDDARGNATAMRELIKRGLKI